MIRKTLLTLGLTAGLVVTGTGVASAHECFVANRSEQGNAGASHSANWYTLQLAELYSHAHGFLGGDPITPEQLEVALRMSAEQGIPSSFTVFEKFTIPRSAEDLESMTSKSADGKGIDHFFVAYGEQIIGIYLTATAPVQVP